MSGPFSTPFFLAASGNMWPGDAGNPQAGTGHLHTVWPLRPVRPAEMPGGGAYVVNGNSKGCLVVVGMWGYHLGKLSLVHSSGSWACNKAFAVHCHEIHVFRGCMLGGADKIAPHFPLVSSSVTSTIFPWHQFVQYFFYGAESFYGVEFFHGAINPPCFLLGTIQVSCF